MSNSKTPLVDRFGPDAADVEFGSDAPSLLGQLAARGSVRKFRSDPVPGCVKTFFRPQKLHATGDDPRRHDGLSIFLQYRVWSQSWRDLGPR